MAKHRREEGGFSLMEVLVAMTVLLIAISGAIGGLLTASANITDGQMRQFRASLAEEYTQRYLLLRRDKLDSNIVTCAGCGNLDLQAIGGPSWNVDAAWAIPPATGLATVKTTPGSCAAVPVGQYCREVAVTDKLPGGADPAQGKAYTIWARVVRGGESAASALVHREVLIQ